MIAGQQFSNLRGRELSLGELSNLPLISLGKDTKTYDFYSRLFSDHGLAFDLSVEAATTDQILPMVEHDMGLGFLPYDFARASLDRGNVFEVKLKEMIPPRRICLVRDRHNPISMAASVLLQMVIESSDF